MTNEQIESRLQELESLHETFTGKTLPGVLRWFDAASGEGMAKVAGHFVYVHFSAIEGIDKNGYQWPTDADRVKLSALGYNTPARFKVYVSGSGSLMAESVKLGVQS